MGAGRHTQTFQVVASAGPSGGGAIGPPPQRNLGKTELGGVIFGCTHVTMNECLTKNLFGLPLQHIKYVQHIRPGMCLFMFNYSGRLLHGIYEAVSDGALNIDASAWTEGRGKTQFPAQVKVKIRQSCSPLSEAVFKEAIQDNYFAEGKFTNELTIPQRDHLLALFTRNMQAPTKSLSTYSGASVKGWKKVEDHVETIGAAKPSTGNAWGKVANTDDAKPSIGNAWGKKVEDPVENVGAAKPSIGNAWGKGANTDDAKPSIGNAWGKDANTDDAKPSIGNAWGKDANTDDAKPSIGNAWGKDANTDDARQRSVLEKLQRLDPSRASQEEQQPAEVEELPANTIVQSGQMRQDLPDIHRLMVELRACTDQQFQQQKTLEKLLVTNGILEQSQARTAAELAKVRLEMSELKSQLIICNTQGQEYRNNLLHIPTSRSPVSEAQGVPKTLQDIYILGGLAETWLDSVVGFSPQSNQLKDVASLLAPRSYAASSILHGCIYLYGGGDGTSWSNSVERYNRDSNIWEPCPSMAVKRGSLGGVTLRDKIYAIGGGNGAVSFDDTECFDPIVGTWAATTKMIEKRFCVASAELDGAIYALGGFDGRDYLMSVERFDHREGFWKAVTPMSNQRGSLSAACLNGKLYALGGFDGRDFLNSVEIYDPRANTWTPGPSMISPRAYGVSAVVGDALYTLGGMEYMKQSFETSKMKIEKFTEAAGWEAVPLNNMINRNFAAAAVL